MQLTPDFLKYITYRILSATFTIISINYFMFGSGLQEYLLGGVLFIISMFFHIKYSYKKPVPKQATCLDKSNMLTFNLVSLSMMIGYAISILSIYRALIGEEFSLYLIVASLVIASLGVLSYIFICNKKINT